MFTDINQLKNSLTLLMDAVKITVNPRKLSELDAEALRLFKSSVVQHFEFTYEHCWRMFHDYFVEERPSDPRESLDIAKLFLRAEMSGLITNHAEWLTFHDARNTSAARFEKNLDNDLMQKILGFAQAARKFHLSIDMKSRFIGAATIFNREQDDLRHQSFLPKPPQMINDAQEFILGIAEKRPVDFLLANSGKVA